MSLARFFFSKPRWQSKDDAVRRSAVASDDSKELRAELPRLAREDSDAGVRIAALKRLADPALAQALASDDRDESVRKFAYALFTDLLIGAHSASPALAERVRLLRAQDDMKLIEAMAQRAPEAELRLAAIQRVTRPALLVERATTDSAAEVRQAALDRIEDEELLLRVAERARKSDKKISRLATERVETQRLERGDPVVIGNRARSLCERLERILREGESADTAESITEAWNTIREKAPADLILRYGKARDLYDLSRDPQRVAEMRQRKADREQFVIDLANLETDIAAADALHARESLTARFVALTEKHQALGNDCADPARLSAIVARLAALEAQAAAVVPNAETAPEVDPEAEAAAQAAKRGKELSAVDKQREREQQQARLNELDEAISETSSAIEAGNTAKAHASWARIPALRKSLGAAIPADTRRRLADIEAQYADIARWQRWSDNQRRAQLCEEIEALPTAGLHPDALATRVREAQAEWAQLDRIENRPASASDGLTRRFRALCRDALAPARPYFEKRDELRKQHLAQTVALLERVTATANDQADRRTLIAARTEVAESLRGLDRVDPRERKALAQRHKDTLTTIDERVATLDASVEAAKLALITEAESLSAETDVRSAINAARQLQKRWQASGNGRRNRDEAQWRAFRKAIDAVFARADSERAERSAREQQALADAEALCVELEQLSKAESAIDRAAVSRIEQAWNASAISDPTLRSRFQNAQSAIRERQQTIDRQQRRQRFDIWTSYYTVIRKLERNVVDLASAASMFDALPKLDIAAQETNARLKALLANETVQFADHDALRDCVIELEQRVGLDSPDEDRQRRLDLQVARLSDRLRGTDISSPEQALQDSIVRWVSLGAIASEDVTFETRFERALESALDRLI